MTKKTESQLLAESMVDLLKEDEEHKYDAIQKHFAKGGNVMLATYTKRTLFKPKHAAMFRKPKKEGDRGVYVQRGKNWDYAFPENLVLMPHDEK